MIESVKNQMEQSRCLPNTGGGTSGCPYEIFLVYRYLNLMGTEGAMKADRWIKDLERTFEISGCTETQKVPYAGHLLQGEAGLWWDTKRKLLRQELRENVTPTWERFKMEFDDRFFPESVKQRKVVEFATLTQGSMTGWTSVLRNSWN